MHYWHFPVSPSGLTRLLEDLDSKLDEMDDLHARVQVSRSASRERPFLVRITDKQKRKLEPMDLELRYG